MKNHAASAGEKPSRKESRTRTVKSGSVTVRILVETARQEQLRLQQQAEAEAEARAQEWRRRAQRDDICGFTFEVIINRKRKVRCQHARIAGMGWMNAGMESQRSNIGQ